MCHVLACYDAATKLPCSDDPAELYRVYLDVFVEFWTPTGEAARRRYVGPMPLKHLQAQALGISDAAAGGAPPRTLSAFLSELSKSGLHR